MFLGVCFDTLVNINNSSIRKIIIKVYHVYQPLDTNYAIP